MEKGIATSSLVLLVLFFFFTLKKGNQSRLQRLIGRLLGTKRKCLCNVCVHNMNMQIVLLVTVSRHAIHHNNISNNAGWPVTVLNRCIWTFPSTLFRQRYIWKMAKKEVANVSLFYLSNLRRFWIVKLPFMTFWVFMACHKSHVVFSRRILQDFAIYNQGHWLGMI